MAIPFFMLAGNFMRYGGISKRLLDLADNIVGFFTGGLGAITTFTAMFYAASPAPARRRCRPSARS